MRFFSFTGPHGDGVGIRNPDGPRGLRRGDPRFPGELGDLLARGEDALRAAGEAFAQGEPIDPAAVTLRPPLPQPGKIICIGLNYADHSSESGFDVPAYPTVFARYASSLVGSGQPILRPRLSEQLDYEGEIVAIIGRGGRHIPRERALDHVVGYSIFNDGSVRDYQFKSPQWTVGKTFDATGGFGPDLVTADELPPGCRGLTLETRLNDKVMQHASTDDLIFDVATLVATLSEAFTLSPGDIIVTGTPAGVGLARKPPVWMKPGDVCEVEVEGLGILTNPIGAEPQAPAAVQPADARPIPANA
jgi:2-keto-4-pentenoate hydratase/2-oxohepta-3-ene-1,7-dioic acid hydratase in catechol pathway